MVRKILLGIVGLLLAVNIGILLLAASKPDTFRVDRTTLIDAPPEKIRDHIEDFRKWDAWSPWEKLDTDMRREFSGARHGVGAVYAWRGNRDVGQGRMEIAENTPRRIVIRLDFLEPFEAHNMSEFTFEPEGQGTRVKWSMVGEAPLFARVVHLFIDIDRMVGDKFESGLARLKAIAEI